MFRLQVLQSFKKLHKTRRMIFKDDNIALEAARNRINKEFKKNKHVSDPAVIQELLKFSGEVEHELRTSVVQAREVHPGSYELKINPDTRKLDNVPYRECKS